MKFITRGQVTLLALLPWIFIPSTQALSVDVHDAESIEKAARIVAHGLVSFYNGNETGRTPGILDDAGSEWDWWLAGAMFNALINYWHYTGDSTYNAITSQALLFQTGPDDNYMPPNQTTSEGNDDQVFWGYAAMAAAEYRFPDPPPNQPQWLALAQGVFNSQAARWDAGHCGGGLRWQIQISNPGYTYKNTPSNGGLFNLASRLYAYTGNGTFLTWAEKIFDWLEDIHLIDQDHNVYDGAQFGNGQNCSEIDHTRWTYNQGVLIQGAATLWKATNDTKWQARTLALWDSAKYFFDKNQVMFEICELPNGAACNHDQQSFKAYLARSLSASMTLAPFLQPLVMPYIQASAQAAAQQCSGGTDGVTCGMKWSANGPVWDGSYGVGQQMAALEILGANLGRNSSAPVTSSTGGTSQGDPLAGTGSDKAKKGEEILRDITVGDRVGAGIVTGVICLLTMSGGWLLFR